MLPVIVITREVPAMAALALTNEGVEVAEIRMRDYTNYGRVFTEQWHGGHGFIVVEEDVIPWPGALRQLDACEHEWCCFLFPNGMVTWDPLSGFCDGLGCMKFATALVSRVPASVEWQNRGWDALDGAVHATLIEAGAVLHVHEPPVAHAKAQILLSRRVMLPL